MKTKLPLIVFIVLLVAIAVWRISTTSQKDVSVSPGESTGGHSSSQTGGANQHVTPKIPLRLAPILDVPSELPTLAAFRALLPEDERPLLQAYQLKTNLYDRIAITWALGFVGGDATVPVFKRALTDEFSRRRLDPGIPGRITREVLVLRQTVSALGLIAERSNAAFDFLKQGADPAFWKREAHWQLDVSSEDEYRILAGKCIAAIGMSGRKEAPEFFESLARTMKPPVMMRWPYERTLNDDVVNGAYYYATVRDEGRQVLISRLLGDETDVFEALKPQVNWAATPEGKKWAEWCANFERQVDEAIKAGGK